MERPNLAWVFTAAAVMAACNTGAPTIGIELDAGTGGDGGGGGTGGGGGLGDGACTNTDDQAVYGALTYTNEAGTTFTGDEAASEIAGDCVFGTTSSSPPLPGCGDEAIAVLGCATDCEGVVDDLATCVAECQDGGINEVTGAGLTEACQGCYGATVACGAANCAFMGCADPSSQACIDCQCRFNCTQGFDACSGLPPDGSCD
jgi:hypothetical protein